jgi:hypothetical protein
MREFIAIIVICLISSKVFAAQVHYEDGSVLSVPRGWTVEVVPQGFNTKLFNLKENITGKQRDGSFPFRKPICDYVYPNRSSITPYPHSWYMCFNNPEWIVNSEPSYDFYDSNRDGVVDYGGRAGCSYDPYSPVMGREFSCA